MHHVESLLKRKMFPYEKQVLVIEHLLRSFIYSSQGPL
jgi:hypothetical protein